MNFKSVYIKLSVVAAFAGAMVACNTDVENLEIQKPNTYSELYYKNLRDFKATDHQISFMWFADYTSPHTLGHRFLGLPDSLDICSLWGGIPSDVEGKPNTFYAPKTYEEMRFIQKVKGVKLVRPLFPSIGSNKWLEKYLPAETKEDSLTLIKAFGDSLLRTVYDNDLDGLDLDHEIHGDWMYGENFSNLVKYLGEHIGPKGKDPEKILIVDGWPFDDGYEYITYFVSQAYQSWGAGDLQKRYDEIAEKIGPERFIVTENIGDYYATGGVDFTEADGNQYTETGERLTSLEGMARWNPTQGKKGGFGAFYSQRDYNSNPPYKYFRKGIQIQNPAVR